MPVCRLRTPFFSMMQTLRRTHRSAFFFAGTSGAC